MDQEYLEFMNTCTLVLAVVVVTQFVNTCNMTVSKLVSEILILVLGDSFFIDTSDFSLFMD